MGRKFDAAHKRITRQIVRDFLADAKALKDYALLLGKVIAPKLRDPGAANRDEVRQDLDEHYKRVLQRLGQSIVLADSFAADLYANP